MGNITPLDCTEPFLVLKPPGGSETTELHGISFFPERARPLQSGLALFFVPPVWHDFQHEKKDCNRVG